VSKLTKVKVDYGDEDCVWLDLVDQDGKRLARIEYDHHPDQVMDNVASAICKAAGIEYENDTSQ